MIEAAFVGCLLALGVIIFLRGANPPAATLDERIQELTTPSFSFVDDAGRNDNESLDEMRQKLAVRVLRAVKGDKMTQVISDVAVARVGLETHAVDKIYGALGGAFIAILLGWWLGFVSTLIGMLLVAAAAGALGYNLPDFEVRRKAARGRAEFETAINAFVGLVSVSMSGGGGLNTAMIDAATVGRGWVFETLQDTLADSQLRGESAWRSLDRLGQHLQVDGLIELAGALGLAGGSGARITETLIARAESGRKKAIADARTDAEKRTANLGLPVGSLLIGWVGFLGYPAVANLVSGLT